MWLDEQSLLPGVSWRESIRQAIIGGDFFLACFSRGYVEKARTYMNEELILAIEELRLRSFQKSWFIPVILDDCILQDLAIRASDRLSDIQHVTLSDDWNEGVKKILEVMQHEEIQMAKIGIDYALRRYRKKESQLNVNPEISKRCDELLAKYKDAISSLKDRYGVNYDPRGPMIYPKHLTKPN